MAIALFCLAALAAADEVVLTSGEIVVGDIVVRADAAVVVKTPDGRVVRCATATIKEIRKSAKAEPESKSPPKSDPIRPLDPATPVVVRRNGPAIIGSLGARMGDVLILRTPDGQIVRCPRSDVVEITTIAKARKVHAAKADAVGEDDLDGQCDLALWCAARRLIPEARVHFRRARALAGRVPSIIESVGRSVDEWEQRQLDAIRREVAAGRLAPAGRALDALGACSTPAGIAGRREAQKLFDAARRAGGARESILVRVRVKDADVDQYQLRVFNARRGPMADSPGVITNRSGNGPSLIARGEPYGRIRGAYRLRLTLFVGGKREEVTAVFQASGDQHVWITVHVSVDGAPPFRIEVAEGE